MDVHDPDLLPILTEWPFERGRVNARRIDGGDGRPKLQIRLDLGILQMEFEGRPDGRRPDDCESLLALHQDRRQRYIDETGSDAGFVVSSDDCRALREEAVQYYHRYVGLFMIGEFTLVIRDTSRNLEVFDFCASYGEAEADRVILEQFRPHVLMMRTRARAELALAGGQPRQALSALDTGLEEIRDLYSEVGALGAYDTANEVQLLRGMREALVPRLPSSQKAELRERLAAALAAENYELAAILRDELKLMG